MNKIFRIFLVVTVLVSSFGCAKKDKVKLPGKYIDLMQEINHATPSAELDKVTIKIPAAVANNSWLNSNFSLAEIPGNIKIEPILTHSSSTYKLQYSKNIYGASVTPVIDGGVIYVSDNQGQASAYNLDKLNKPIWTSKVIVGGDEKEFAGGGLALAQSRLVFTFGSKIIVALDQTSGSEVWRYSLSNISRSAPVIRNGKVFALTIDNRLYCLDLNNGAMIWTYEGATEQFGVFGFASPIVTDKLVIAPHSSGQLIALDIKSGEVVWQVSLIKNTNNNTMVYLNDIDMTPIIDHGVIYLSNYAGVMFAINANNGQVNWANDTAGGNKFAWIAGDFIYAVNRYNQLVAVQAKTGMIKWAQNLEEEAGDKKKTKEKFVFSGPIMVNDLLYLTTSDGRLLAFDPITGSKAGEYKIAKAVYSPAIAAANHLYFINNFGTLSIIR